MTVFAAVVGLVAGYMIGSNQERKCDLPGMSKDLVPGLPNGIPSGAPGVPSANCDQIMSTAVASLPAEQKTAILTVWNSGNAAQLSLLADTMEKSGNPTLYPIVTCLRQKANGVKW